MLSDKKTITEIHKLTAHYIRNLKQYRAFFGSLTSIQQAQYSIVTKIGKTKKTTKMTSILKDQSNVEGKLIVNGDLLQKNGGYFSLRLLEGFFILLTLPLSIPILLLWSRISRGTLNFLKTDGAILVERIVTLSNITSNTKLHNENNPLNTTMRINDMLNNTKWHCRYFASKSNYLPREDKVTSLALCGSGVEHEASLRYEKQLTDVNVELAPDNHVQQVNPVKHRNYTDMAATVIASVTTNISSFSDVFYVSIKTKFKPPSLLEEANIKCETLLENIISDVIIITEALSQFNQEQRFINNQMMMEIAEKNLLEKQIINSSFSETPADSVTDARMENQECIDMLRHYSELMKLYPKNPNAIEITLESVEAYHAELKAHHEKVLTIAECLVPELSTQLNIARVNGVAKASSMKL